MDWKNWHLPCKHFMAVFQNYPETGWNALPEDYRNNPYIKLDVEAFPSSEPACTVQDDLRDSENEVLSMPSNTGELPLPKAAAVKRGKSKVFGLLEILKDLTFQTKDMKVLEDTAVGLETLVLKVRAALPQESQLILDEDSSMTYIGTSKKKQPKTNQKKTLKSLKTLRKRAATTASKRRGIAAERKKKYHTRKGIHDLLGNEVDERKSVIEEAVDLSMEAHSDPQEIVSGKKAEVLLEKFKGFVSSLREQYSIFCAKASLADTQDFTMDSADRIGSVIMHDYCDPGMDSVDLALALRSSLPSSNLSDRAKYRLICLLLEQMEQNGNIAVLGKHPKQLDLEGREAFRGLIECLTGKGKKKKVSFSKEALQKKKVALLSEDRTCAFPSGGLQNLPGKNLCFANSLLQCLRITDLHKVLLQHICSEAVCFVCKLKYFIEEGPLSAEELCGNMKEFWPDYTVGQQQDPHEFLQKILGEIQNKCFGFEDGVIAAQDIFYGLQKSTVQCSSCHQKSTKMERYTDISVSIQKADDINQALREHFADEKVDFTCSRCGNKTMAVKETKLISIPKNVIIQLKRFSSARRKISKKMHIQMEILLRKYSASEMELEDKCRLFGIIIHQGSSISTGHYYCFLEFGGQWFRIDDMKIRKVSVPEVNLCMDQSYMLFYRALPRPYIS